MRTPFIDGFLDFINAEQFATQRTARTGATRQNGSGRTFRGVVVHFISPLAQRIATSVICRSARYAAFMAILAATVLEDCRAKITANQPWLAGQAECGSAGSGRELVIIESGRTQLCRPAQFAARRGAGEMPNNSAARTTDFP
jgi:hypothetical protein